jgi:hypothetical protein
MPSRRYVTPVARTTALERNSVPWERTVVCSRVPGRSAVTSCMKRNLAPNSHACSYALVASAAPLIPAGNPRKFRINELLPA